MARLRYRPIEPAADPRPMMEINTTPLIDVLLVLLIMMILTVPVVTHKVALDLPGGPPRADLAPVHRIDIAASGALSWDGRLVDRAALPARLAALKADPAQPMLHIRSDGEAPYGVVDRTLADVKRAGIEKIGLVDNGRFGNAW